MQTEFKMKNTVKKTFALLTIFSAATFAQTMADAQKAYVAGNWKEAAAAYEKACPNEPKEKQAECYLWNVLALSQTGDVQSFKIAGKRLDSLIQNENPQNSIYADLMMTSAQFRLYLGKYDKAAEDLIHAIETSHPHQAVVLQKVCTAVKAKIHSEDLIERCNLLSTPDSLKALQQAMQKAPKTASDTIKADEPKQAVADSTKNVKPAPAVEQVKTEVPATKPAPAPVENTSKEYWTLQLGAFGTKANADLLVTNLKKQKITCTIVEQPRGERTLYLVQTGKFETKDQAVDFAANKLAPLKIEYQPLLKR